MTCLIWNRKSGKSSRRTAGRHYNEILRGGDQRKQVAQLMKELGFGRPEEKISWREYRKLKLKGRKGVEESRPCGVKAPEKEERQA